VDSRSNSGLAEILRSEIGGTWSPSLKPWENRREAMLELFGKVLPFALKPALQIDPVNARLLVEALSGR